MRFEILGKNVIYVVFTKDLFGHGHVEAMRNTLDKIKWDEDKYIMLPSEYIEKIEVIDRGYK